MSATNDAPTTQEGAAADAEIRPRLLKSLRVENLKSLVGEHDIPFAPLTLIYGPHAAGKSTIIQGLRIFMHAVRAGRRDALNPFWEDVDRARHLDVLHGPVGPVAEQPAVRESDVAVIDEQERGWEPVQRPR